MPLPDRCQVVVIGGGVVGCSIAYHLAQRGVTDVLVIERQSLTHGSTWHAAGLVGQLRSSSNLTQLMRQSVQTYQTLEQATGYATGWHGVGSLRLAVQPGAVGGAPAPGDDRPELRLRGRAGLPRRGAASCSRCSTSTGVHGATWVPSDGYVDPSQLTHAVRDRSAGGRRTDRAGLPGRADRAVRPAGHCRDHRPGTGRVRHSGQRDRDVGRRDGPAGRRRRRRQRGRAPVRRHREARRHPGRPADPARPGRAVLSQARGRRAGHRRLGGRHARALADHPARPRAGAVRPGPGAVRTAGCGRRTTDPAVRRDRHPDLGQRADPVLAGRRAADGGHRGPGQPVPLLRLLGRHRCRRRRGPGDGRLDHRRRPRDGPLAVRRAPVRAVAQRAGLPPGPVGRRLRALLRHRLPQPRAHRTARAAPQPAVRRPRSRGARSSARSSAGSGPTGSRRRAPSRSSGRPSARSNAFDARRGRAPGRAHRGRRRRPELVREVRGHRPGRARRCCSGSPAPTSTCPSGKVVYTQLLNAGGGIEADVTITRPGRGPVLLRHRQRLRPARRDLPAAARADRRLGLDPRGHRRARRPQRLRPARPRGPAAADLGRPRQRRVPVHDRAAGRHRARAGLAPCGRRTSASWAGSCTCRSSTPPTSTRGSWRQGNDLGIRNVGYRAIESLRLEKQYLAWAVDIRSDNNPYEAGLALRRPAGQAGAPRRPGPAQDPRRRRDPTALLVLGRRRTR